VNENIEQEQVAPAVVERVSLKEIKAEKKAEQFEEMDKIMKDYMALTPEEKEAVKKALFK
jgi:hypothetical protein